MAPPSFLISEPNIIAVMVVYQPPDSVQDSLAALLPQVQRVILVDNGNNAALQQRLGDSVIWLTSPQNNLGMAQNLGIRHAQQLGADFVLLMDDDSLPAPQMVAELVAAYRPEMGVIAPYLDEPVLGKPPLYIQACGKWGFRRVGFTPATPLLTDIFYACASGSLIPMTVLERCGMMEESFGIYFIDTDFCLRLRKHGFSIVAVQAARLTHRIGQRSQHRVLGKTISTTNHSAAARYLMCRNRKALWWRYARSDTGYVLFDMLRTASEMLRVLCCESNKTRKLLAMFNGLLAPIPRR
jgi:rhamnosyltransferase